MKLFSDNAIKVWNTRNTQIELHAVEGGYRKTWNTKNTQIELYAVEGGYRLGIFKGVFTTTYGELSAEIIEYRDYKSRNAAMNYIRRNYYS